VGEEARAVRKDALPQPQLSGAQLVSPYTKVMSRVRIRDLIAIVGPILHRERFPRLPRMSEQDSLSVLIQALRSREDFSVFLSRYTKDKTDFHGQPPDNCLTINGQTRDLCLTVLQTLSPTGLLRAGSFEVALISQNRPVRALPSSSKTYPRHSPHGDFCMCEAPVF
jgi:hypothetical protein